MMPQFQGDENSLVEEFPVIFVDDDDMDTTTMFPNTTTVFGKSPLQDISNQVSTPTQSETAAAVVSDDDFMKRFPEIDFLHNDPCSSSSKKKRTKGPQTIAAYVIDTEESCSYTQDVPKEAVQDLTFKRQRDPSDREMPSTSKRRRIDDPDKATQATNDVVTFKRPHDLSNKEVPSNNEKMHIDDDNDDESRREKLAHNNALNPIFSDIVLQQTGTENESIPDSGSQVEGYLESDVADDNYEIDINNPEELPFPDLDIDFDVEAMLTRANQGISTATMGEKAYQQYLVERRQVLECIKQLYNCLKNAPINVVEMDPDGLKVPLMPHQRQAMKWMKWREEQRPCSGGILADEMGLGKTFQMIALIVAAKNQKKAQMLAEDPSLLHQEEYDDAEDWGSLDRINGRYHGRTLVVCPVSLMEQWDREISSKCKSKVLSSYIYHGVEKKKVFEGNLIKYDVVITTYDTINIEYKNYLDTTNEKSSRLFNIHWNRIVLDEAHKIRNHLSKNCEAVCELKGKTKWVITGTPIQNREGDFFPLLKFLNCTPFVELTVWNKWVNNKKSLGNKRLIVITKSLMLRRTKQGLVDKEIIKPLPEKHFTIIQVELDREELIVYQKLLLYSQSFFMEYLKKKEEGEQNKLLPKSYYSSTSLIAQQVPKKLSRMMRTLLRHHTHKMTSHYLMVLIIRLRQLCCHPALIKSMLDKEDTDLDDIEGDRDIQRMDNSVLEYINKIINEVNEDAEADDYDGFEIDESEARNVMTSDNPLFADDRNSSKVKAILETIQNILNVGEKVIVVSQWTSFLQVIGRNLALMPDVTFATFSGNTKLADRQVMVDRINDYDDKLNVLLLSLTAGACGLNLCGANHLLMIDNHWNPQLELQAQDRIHRFGQVNDVHIYRFVCKDTIEERIVDLQERKLKIASKVLDGEVADNLTIQDLTTLFS